MAILLVYICDAEDCEREPNADVFTRFDSMDKPREWFDWGGIILCPECATRAESGRTLPKLHSVDADH